MYLSLFHFTLFSLYNYTCEIEKYDFCDHGFSKNLIRFHWLYNIYKNILIPTHFVFLQQGRLLHILPGKPPKQETDTDGGNSNFKKKKQDDQKKNSQRLVTVD